MIYKAERVKQHEKGQMKFMGHQRESFRICKEKEILIEKIEFALGLKRI